MARSKETAKQNSSEDNSGIQDASRLLAQRLLARFAQGEETAIPNLTFYRFDAPTVPTGYLLEPSVCWIFQGAKRVILGDEEHNYEAGSFFVTSVDLPIIAQILKANTSAPYVGLVLKLDRMEIVQLVMANSLPPKKTGSTDAIATGKVSQPLLATVSRLVDLLEEPAFISTLSPLIQKELLFRLLMSACGAKIRQIAIGDSPTHQISRAIDWIKGNLAEPLRVENLAACAGMSVSTLHHHFRSLTALSPLQYQKRLRLNEARRLMLSQHLDASTAAFEVGYESPSQFSREYSRMFGAPPLRDIKNLCEK